MKRKISTGDLRKIRKAVTALPEVGIGKDGNICVMLELPSACNAATLEYAYEMVHGLSKVQISADFSITNHMATGMPAGKPYEVMQSMPFSLPVIRIYQQDKAEMQPYSIHIPWLKSIGKKIKDLLSPGSETKR
jgi:hypothetical protein